LQARMQLLRLIATQRSKFSSVISRSSASPPEIETPTLLCRMSMRPPALVGVGHEALDVGFLGNVGLEGHGRALALLDHVHGFLGAAEVMIHAQNLGALTGEGEGGGGGPFAHAFARALPRPDDDGDAIFEAHSQFSFSVIPTGARARKWRDLFM